MAGIRSEIITEIPSNRYKMHSRQRLLKWEKNSITEITIATIYEDGYSQGSFETIEKINFEIYIIFTSVKHCDKFVLLYNYYSLLTYFESN